MLLGIVKGAFALEIERSRFLIEAKPWAQKEYHIAIETHYLHIGVSLIRQAV